MAIGWGAAELPRSGRQLPLERFADRIISGQPFDAAVLARLLPAVEGIEAAGSCRPGAIRSAAVIRLRMVELAESKGDRTRADENLKALDDAIRASLACSPADPFLWLVLHRVEDPKNGFKSDYFDYLRLSYQLGPNEGWLILKRSPFVFSNFEKLPPDLAKDAVREFTRLVADGRYAEAAEIFGGPAWHARDAILPWLATLPVRNREAFAKVAYDKGLDVAIPGVSPPDSKHWH
jgi:hypothetical protein